MKVSNAEIVAYENLVKANKAVCFFNTLWWIDMISQYSSWDYEIKCIEVGEDQIFMPLYYRNKFIFKVYKNSIFGPYCGLVSDVSINYETEIEIVEYLFREKNYNYIGSPFINEKHSAEKGNYTQVTDLDTVSLETLSTNHQRNIKKALKNELSIEISEVYEEWQVYHKLYLEVVKQRGVESSNNYSMILFEMIFKLPTEFRKLWLIKKDGDIIGGGVFFYYNVISYWHGVNNRISKKLGGSQLLHFEVMKHGLENGYKRYDFGPSGGNVGVAKFKEGFNSKVMYFTSLSNRTIMYQFLEGIYQNTMAKKR